MASKVLHSSDQNFDRDVLKATRPVLVDFWASWCGPCRMIGPVIDELSEIYSDKIKFVKLSTDDNTSVPAEFNIRSIPTLMVFKEGKIVDKIIGTLPKAQLEEFIKKQL